MNRTLSSATTLENLRREAKRWRKAVHEGDSAAKARLARVWDGAPGEPTLRDIQRAIALEHGFAGWGDLKSALAAVATAPAPRVDIADSFLMYACADPLLANGPRAHAERGRTALRILQRYPEIATHSMHTAVVCGDQTEVRRLLRLRPELATERGGPTRPRRIAEHDALWSPILHLCFGRLPVESAADNAVDIAKALIDHGADPNDFFAVGSAQNRYTALCGVAGEGEDGAPPHPRRDELARLLVERGADLYDSQLFYNTHFNGDILWFLKLIHDASVRRGHASDWDDPSWSMINLGGYGHGARYLLQVAVEHDNLELAEWILAHGGDPNDTSLHPEAPGSSLHEEAVRRGFVQMAELLLRFGAKPSAPAEPTSEDAFAKACFDMDRAKAEQLVAKHPDQLRNPRTLFAATKRDRADVVALLLDLGTPIELEDASKQRALHIAAYHDAIKVAKLLLERGAEIDPVESSWNNTPLDAALYSNHSRMVDLLSKHSRDIHLVAFSGNAARVRELLDAEPDRAKVIRKGSSTLLMWLPDDEARALEIATLLLARGADPTLRNDQGATPAAYAEKRGLYDLGALLRTAASRDSRPTGGPRKTP